MAKTCLTDRLIIDEALKSVFDTKYKGKRQDLVTVMAIADNTSGKKLVPQQDKECTKFNLYWEELCGTGIEACDDSCDFNPASADLVECAEYTIGECAMKGFSLNEQDYDCLGATALFNEAVASQMAKGELALIQEEIIPKLIAKLEAMSGENLYNQEYNVTPTETTIGAAAWNANLLSYFKLVEQFNKYNNGVLLSGNTGFGRDIMNIMASGSEEAGLYAERGIYLDMFNILTHSGDANTYLFDADRLAFVSTNFNESTTPSIAYPDGEAWSTWHRESSIIKGLKIDVHHKIKCASDSKVQHIFKQKIRWDLFEAPADLCDNSPNAVKLVCG